jgi:hypothetical protein
VGSKSKKLCLWMHASFIISAPHAKHYYGHSPATAVCFAPTGRFRVLQSEVISIFWMNAETLHEAKFLPRPTIRAIASGWARIIQDLNQYFRLLELPFVVQYPVQR